MTPSVNGRSENSKYTSHNLEAAGGTKNLPNKISKLLVTHLYVHCYTFLTFLHYFHFHRLHVNLSVLCCSSPVNDQ